jgi:hypothetical protein
MAAGCSGDVLDQAPPKPVELKGFQAQSFNGLSSRNGLASRNGLSTRNGLANDGIANAEGNVNTPEGRSLLAYLVACALPEGHSVTKSDDQSNLWRFDGHLGMGAGWEYGSCDTDCQEWVSGCLLAHVNTAGNHVDLWITADPVEQPQIGYDVDPQYPIREAAYFGNVFAAPSVAYFCKLGGADQGVVSGRVGSADFQDAPYGYQPLEADLDTSECGKYCASALARNGRGLLSRTLPVAVV